MGRKWGVLLLLVTGACFFQSCTAAAPLATSEMVESKLGGVTVGETQNEVIDGFGKPHYTVSFSKAPDVYDVWEYELGNFMYRDAGVLIFKNGYVVAVRRNTYETLKYLEMVKVIPDAEFSSLRDNS